MYSLEGVPSNVKIKIYLIRFFHILILLFIFIDLLISLLFKLPKIYHISALSFELSLPFFQWLFGGCILTLTEYWLLKEYQPDLQLVGFTDNVLKPLNLTDTQLNIVSGIALGGPVLLHIYRLLH